MIQMNTFALHWRCFTHVRGTVNDHSVTFSSSDGGTVATFLQIWSGTTAAKFLNMESSLEMFASTLILHLSCHKLGNFKALNNMRLWLLVAKTSICACARSALCSKRPPTGHETVATPGRSAYERVKGTGGRRAGAGPGWWSSCCK